MNGKVANIAGPVIRITPDEIHLSDPENLDKIHHLGSRYGKSAAFYGAFGTNNATFTTPSPDIHRVKRAALNPFFSRKKVLDLEEIVQQRPEDWYPGWKTPLEVQAILISIMDSGPFPWT